MGIGKIVAVLGILACSVVSTFAGDKYFRVYRDAQDSMFLDTQTAKMLPAKSFPELFEEDSDSLYFSQNKILDCWLKSEAAQGGMSLEHVLITYAVNLIYPEQAEVLIFKKLGTQVFDASGNKTEEFPAKADWLEPESDFTKYSLAKVYEWGKKNLSVRKGSSGKPGESMQK